MATCVINTPEFEAIEKVTNSATAWKEFARSKITGEAMRSPETVLEESWYRGQFLNKKPGEPWTDRMDGFQQQMNSWPEYNLLANPIKYDFKGHNDAVSLSAIRQLADRLKEKTGINYEIISQEQAIELTKHLDIKQQYVTGKPAFYLGGVAYLVSDFVSATNVLHEFAHPIIKAIAVDNPKLFNNLYTQIQNQYPDIIEYLKSEYDYLDINSSEFKEEAIVTALDLFHSIKQENPKAKGPFIDLLNDILYAIRKFLRKITNNKVKVENINEFSTLEDLANLMTDDTTFELDDQIITNSDFAAYASTYNDYLNELRKAASPADIQGALLNTYDIVIEQLKALENNPNYRFAAEILKDKYGELEVQNIVKNINRVKDDAKALKDQAKMDRARASEFLKSILLLEEMIKKTNASLRTLEKEAKENENNNRDNRDVLQNVYYLNNLLNGWNELINEYINTLEENNVDIENDFYKMLSAIKRKIENTQSIANNIYTYKITDVLSAEIQPLMEAIDMRYEALLKFYKDRNAPQWKIADVEKEYAEIKLNPGKIQEMLKGDLGDAHFLNSFLEGYMNNQDPVVFAFASYVKNGLNDLNSNSLEKMNKFLVELEPLLQAAGFNRNRLSDLGERLTQIDSTPYREGKELKFKKVYKFINPWKGQDEAIAKMNEAINNARNVARESGDYTEVQRLMQEKEDFQRKYFYTEYTQKYYDRYNILNKDELGREAKDLLTTIDFKIKELQNSILSPTQDIVGLDELDALQRERKYLFSLTDENGKLKSGRDLEIAKRLQEYNASAKDMFTKITFPGLFEQAYREAENYFIDQGYERGTPAYEQLMNEWLKKNSKIELSSDFYVMRANLYAEIQELEEQYRDLVSQLGYDQGIARTEEEMLDLYKELNDILYRHRDESGQPQGSLMNKETLERVFFLESEIERIKTEAPSFNNLTRDENSWLRDYFDRIKAGEEISDEDKARARELNKKKVSLKGKKYNRLSDDKKLIADQAEEIKNLIYSKFDELRDMQTNVPTEDYLDIINNLTAGLPDDVRETLEDLTLHKEITEDIANELLESGYDLINTMRNASPEFKEWFDANHYLKEYYDITSETQVKYYVRSKAWNRIVPTQSNFINSTTITNSLGEEVVIPRVPNRKYITYKLKDKPEDGYVTPKISILDAIRMGDITKANWDGDNWLPKLDAVDPETGELLTDFVSNEFFLLKSTKPAEYQLLMKLLEFHFANQQGHSRADRLGFEIPRFIRSKLETLQRRKNRPINPDTGEPVKDNPFSILANKIRRFFTRSSEDMEEGMNPMDNAKVMIYTESIDEDTSKIKVRGLYDMELDVTSLDILTSLTRYSYSLDRKAKLVEMNPVARTLQSILSDPKNAVKDLNKYDKRKFKNQNVLVNLPKKGRYVRKYAIDNFIEREFESIVQTGWGSENAFLQSLSNSMMKFSALGYFALNIQSAIKNSMGARMQALIEGAAGKYYNNRDYAKGTYWANKTMAEVSFQIYKYGPKSLNIQITELFDPVQGRFEEKLWSGEKIMRTGLSDVANNPLGLLTNTRKWTELNAQYSIFAAMMYSQKVDQTINGVTKQISYIDAFEIKDGTIVLKEGIDKEWGAGGKKFKMMKNRIHAVSNDLNGAFAKFDYAEADRYFLFRQLMFLRRWFTRMLMNRFQASGSLNPRSWRPRYDVGRNDIYMGYYTEAIKFLLVDLLGTGGKAFNMMTPEQKAAFKRIGMDVAIIILFSLLISMVFGFNEDDEDKYEKLRERSGPFPIFFTADSEHPFNFGGWVANNALITMMGIRQEQLQWIPIPGIGLSSYMEWLELQPLAMRNTIINMAKTSNQLVNLMTGDDSAFYVRSVGPYAWQQEGAPKILNSLAKFIGLTGSQTDAVKATKDFVAIQNLKGN